MKKHLAALSELGVCVFEYTSIDSTNNEARRYALDGGDTPAAFFADSQSAGRGRMGRSFYSPDSTGVYMTLLLDVTDAPPVSAVTLTSVAAVAVARVIERWSGKEVGIKWVNDIYLNGRKICGILAESFSSGERRYACVGVGINLCTTDFPEELMGIAGALELDATEGVRRGIAADVCREIIETYELVRLGERGYIEEYKSRSIALGTRVSYTADGESREGVAFDVDGYGALLVRHDDGSTCRLSSGEISLRVK